MSSSIIPYIIHESPTTAAVTRITEEKSGRIVAEAVLQDMDTENRNHRIYTSKELLPQLVCERTKELLDTGNMKGENGHPMSKELARQQTIDPNNVVVKFLKFWTEGNKVKAQFKGCNNRLGDEFNRDLLDDEKPSFSLRALGGIDLRNGKAYVKNVKLITYDRVIFPSHKVAYTERIVSESASLISQKSAAKLVVPDNYKGIIVPITNESVIKALQHESANVKSILENFDVKYDNIEIIPTTSGIKVQMLDETGNILVIGLEQHIQNEIMDYCASIY